VADRLFRGGCRGILQPRIEVADAGRLPLADESVDLTVTSPPYGLEMPYAGALDPAEGWAAFMRRWLREAYRVARQGGRLALNVPLDTTKGGNRPTYPQAWAAAQAAGWSYRWAVVWYEGNISRSVARGSQDSASAPHVIAPVEIVAVFHKGEWRREPPCPSDLAHEEWLEWTCGVWRFGGEGRSWERHPAAFPEELPRRLIKLLSFPGDTVLDPFVGSGTTALAAHRLGRAAIGFDITAEYVGSAKRRLQAVLG
jgi:site-specific DNA-methyltransferase (adenine-specific)